MVCHEECEMTRVTLEELAELTLTDDWTDVRVVVRGGVDGAVWLALSDAVCVNVRRVVGGVVRSIVWYVVWAVVKVVKEET